MRSSIKENVIEILAYCTPCPNPQITEATTLDDLKLDPHRLLSVWLGLERALEVDIDAGASNRMFDGGKATVGDLIGSLERLLVASKQKPRFLLPPFAICSIGHSPDRPPRSWRGGADAPDA